MFTKEDHKDNNNKASKYLDIKLDKKKIFIGETIKGILIITATNTIKAKHLKLEAYGEEKTKVREEKATLWSYKLKKKEKANNFSWTFFICKPFAIFKINRNRFVIKKRINKNNSRY